MLTVGAPYPLEDLIILINLSVILNSLFSGVLKSFRFLVCISYFFLNVLLFEVKVIVFDFLNVIKSLL